MIGNGKVVNGKYKSENHTYLLIGEIVIDITSDQYGGPKTYVGFLKEPWSL